ncbi:MAG: hypothetical protein IJK26_05360 [Clostridia bacterium]|nr:hypothetical protein [Clostridia bacterium]
MSKITVELPCKVGDTVYMLADRKTKVGRKNVCEKFVITGKIDHFTIGDAGIPVADICLADDVWCVACEPEEYYLTKEDADKALAEWKKEN